MNWFRNLKRWQKGGLIGLAVGVILGPFAYYLGEFLQYPHNALAGWVRTLHFTFYAIMHIINPPNYSPLEPVNINPHGYEPYVFMGAIVVFYGGLGIIMGSIQQITKPSVRWPLTGLLALFLPIFYTLSVLVFIMFCVGSAIVL